MRIRVITVATALILILCLVAFREGSDESANAATERERRSPAIGQSGFDEAPQTGSENSKDGRPIGVQASSERAEESELRAGEKLRSGSLREMNAELEAKEKQVALLRERLHQFLRDGHIADPEPEGSSAPVSVRTEWSAQETKAYMDRYIETKAEYLSAKTLAQAIKARIAAAARLAK